MPKHDLSIFRTPTSDKFGHIFHQDREFLFNNVPYDVGWYFWDIDEEPFGPFTDEEHAKRALTLYTKRLMSGEITPQRKLIKPKAGKPWN